MIFMDAARLTMNQSTSGAIASSLMLKGTGVGLLWDMPRQWQGSTYFARPLGNSPASTESNKFTRIAIEAKKFF
jgi:hypothetical protein